MTLSVSLAAWLFTIRPLCSLCCSVALKEQSVSGVVTEAECSGCCSGESLLTEWLYLIRCGCTLHGSGLDTPLEKAFSMLPRLKDNFRSLKKKDLIKVEHLLKEQVMSNVHRTVLSLNLRFQLKLGLAKITI